RRPPPAATRSRPLRSRPASRGAPALGRRAARPSPSRRPPSAPRRPGTARWAAPSVASPVARSPRAPPVPPRRAGARRGAAFPWGVSSRRTAAGGPDRPRHRPGRGATPARRPPGSLWPGRRAAWSQPIRAAPAPAALRRGGRSRGHRAGHAVAPPVDAASGPPAALAQRRQRDPHGPAGGVPVDVDPLADAQQPQAGGGEGGGVELDPRAVVEQQRPAARLRIELRDRALHAVHASTRTRPPVTPPAAAHLTAR